MEFLRSILPIQSERDEWLRMARERVPNSKVNEVFLSRVVMHRWLQQKDAFFPRELIDVLVRNCSFFYHPHVLFLQENANYQYFNGIFTLSCTGALSPQKFKPRLRTYFANSMSLSASRSPHLHLPNSM